MNRLPIKVKNELLLIDFNEIVYIEKLQKKTIIHTKNRDIEVTEGLGYIYDKLNEDIFIRTHKSYIVNINYISKVVPWGGKTYRIALKGSKDNAWFSYERYRKFLNSVLSTQ